MADALEKLRAEAQKPGRTSCITPCRRASTTPTGFKQTWVVVLRAQVKGRWIRLRRLTDDELGAVGLRPSQRDGYSRDLRRRPDQPSPEAAAREAARRISEVTGLPVVEE